MVIGSSSPLPGSPDLPSGAISCMSAEPPEVTRNDTRTGAFIPGCGPIAAWPFQFPARVFSRANASCADACCTSGFLLSDLGVSDWGQSNRCDEQHQSARYK